MSNRIIVSSMIFRCVNFIRKIADIIVMILFSIMMGGVLVQVVGRYLFNYSIAGTEEAARFAQVWMVLFGAGVAMRLGRHVAIDLLVTSLPAGVARILNVLIAFGALWFLYLVVLGALPLIEVGKFETSPALELPMWIMYLSLVVGAIYFGLEVGLWVFDRWKDPRARQQLMTEQWEIPSMALAFSAFLVFLIIGMPIFFCLGIAAALTLLLTTEVPIAIVSQRIFGGLNSFTIMAIPFFIFAGALMDVGGISRRIVDFATALVGWITGSVLMVSVVAATGLAAISGSGSADTAAISAIMQPELRRRKYDVDFSAGVIAAAGSLAQVIPPSLMMVVVAMISNESTGALFLAGVVPGLMTTALLLCVSYIHAIRGGPQYREVSPFNLRHLGKTFVGAIPALGMPVIIIGGIVGGVFTPTEAAAVAGAYGIICSVFIYREMKAKDFPGLILRTVGLSAAVMMIIGAANIFGWLVAEADVPRKLAAWIMGVTNHPWFFLAIVNVLLLFVGMFMESIAAILILVPVLMPIAIDLGVNPIHFGAIVVMNFAIGMVTPPYGITLFIASSVAGRSIIQVSRRSVGPVLMMFAVLLLVTYVPDITLFLPGFFGFKQIRA